MNWLRRRHYDSANPEPLTWGTRLVFSSLALLLLAAMTAFIAPVIRAPWWIVAGHVTLGTCGACFLLMLLLGHVAQHVETRQRQFSLRLTLLTMVGLGMMLAGIGGIFRLAHFDPSQTTVRDWLALLGVFGMTFVIGTPLLAVLLETAVTLANAMIRLPLMRRLLFRGRNGTNRSN